MRGRTLNEAFIILDEAQNTTSEQMKMFLTRLGFGSKAVITGDITQVDLPPGRSRAQGAMRILSGVEVIKFVQFDKRDVVRHHIVQAIVNAYECSRRDARADSFGRVAPRPRRRDANVRGEPPHRGRVDVVRSVRHGPSAAAVARWTGALLASALSARARRTRRPFRAPLRRPADADLNRRFMERSPDRRPVVPSGEPGFSATSPSSAVRLPTGEPALSRARAGTEAPSRARRPPLLGHDHEVDGGRMFRLQGRLVRKVFGPGPDGVPPEASA